MMSKINHEVKKAKHKVVFILYVYTNKCTSFLPFSFIQMDGNRLLPNGETSSRRPGLGDKAICCYVPFESYSY